MDAAGCAARAWPRSFGGRARLGTARRRVGAGRRTPADRAILLHAVQALVGRATTFTNKTRSPLVPRPRVALASRIPTSHVTHRDARARAAHAHT